MSFIIDFTDTSGNEGSVIPDGGFFYTDKLNVINEGNFIFSGSGELKRSLIQIGSQVKVYRNGTLEFHGLVDDVEFYEGGAINAHASGYEVWLAKENGAYAGSPWNATASATIFSATIAESNYFTAGTINAGVSIDFRAIKSSSLMNVIKNLILKTSQDIGIDYPNLEIDILDHKGSSTSVETLNVGIQIADPAITNSYPIGNKIKVYGKGDGENQIVSDDAQGQDASSQSTYGILTYIIEDKTITTVAEANLLVNAEVIRLKNPREIYNFDVLNPAKDWVAGDVITINAPSQDVNNEEVRIVELKRGIKNNEEFLECEVTNKDFSELTRKRDEIIAELDRKGRDNQSYMQGTTSILTFSDMINASNSAPLRVYAQIPSSFIFDEAGNRRVNSFDLDYDVDKYRRGVGTATESNVAPDVGGSSADTQPGVSGSSADTQPGVSGTSATQTPTSSAGISVYSATQQGQDGALGNRTAAVFMYATSAGSGVTYDTTNAAGLIYNGEGSEQTVRPKFEWPTGGSETGGPYDLSNGSIYTYATGFTSASQHTGWFIFEDDYRNATHWTCTIANLYKHTHGTHDHGDGSYYANNHGHDDGSYYANNHGHADGTYASASHNHSVVVGDSVSDAGSVNATQISEIKVYHWNGSSWDLKHTITNTGATLGIDLDISNSNTLPDAAGFWKVEIKTDNATPDLVQGIIKLKHQLDT